MPRTRRATRLGRGRSLVAAAWSPNPQHPPFGPTTRALHGALDRYGIAHEFEIYEGNHINRVAERMETKVLPFCSATLDFGRVTK